jgi:hypothetical protein
MMPTASEQRALQEDPNDWFGAEAAVGAQAGRHVRRQARGRRQLATTILGLAFFGGLALGVALASRLRPRAK